MPGRKQISLYRQKRKRGFYGVQKQFVEQEASRNDSATVDDDEDVVLSQEPGPSSPSTIPKNFKSPSGKLINKSLEKLKRNCPLFAEEQSEYINERRKCLDLYSKDSLGLASGRELAHGFKVMNTSNLLTSLSKAAVCRLCKDPKGTLQLWQDNSKRRGLHEVLFWKCSNCDKETDSFSTSPFVNNDKMDVSEINIRLTQGGVESGNGLAGLSKICCALDVPPPVTTNAFSAILKKITTSYQKEAQESLCKAAKNLKDLMQINTDINDEVVSSYVPVSVSVDGTWQKRYGYSSLLGVVFILSVETGEVLDYEVQSKICFECKFREKWEKESEKYKNWYSNHEEHCEVNHKGSSEAMEKEAAVKMFLRSMEKHQLVYTTYVGDGDSSSFSEVADACFKKFGDGYLVLKEDCIGHIQKRMGSNLRNFKNKNKGRKLADGGTIGGRGRLTDAIIDSLQNYYGYAIRNHTNNIEGMKKAIWAIFYHCIQGENEPDEVQHQFCPEGENSWCRFQRDRASHTATYDQRKCLPSVFRKELKPIFERLSGDELLSRCQKGLTQNQNEALNNVLWSKCPKRVFCGKQRLECCVASSVLQWNAGAGSAGNVLKRLGVLSLGSNTIKGYKSANEKRVKKAEAKCKTDYQRRRQILRKMRKQNTKAGAAYASGGFSIHKVPDKDLCKVDDKDNMDVVFIDEKNLEMVYVEKSAKRRKIQ